MHNTVGGFVHRFVHNSNKSSALFRREVEQQTEAGSNLLTPMRRSQEFLYNTQTMFSALCVWHRIFNRRYCSSFFSFCVCRVFEASLTSHLLLWIQRGLCSQIGFYWISWDFILGGQAWRKSADYPEALILTFAFIHSPLTQSAENKCMYLKHFSPLPLLPLFSFWNSKRKKWQRL